MRSSQNTNSMNIKYGSNHNISREKLIRVSDLTNPQSCISDLIAYNVFFIFNLVSSWENLFPLALAPISHILKGLVSAQDL